MPCLKCDLPHLLEASRPPDPELVDLIEQAFLEGQIDGLKANLSYVYLVGQDSYAEICANFDRDIH